MALRSSLFRILPLAAALASPAFADDTPAPVPGAMATATPPDASDSSEVASLKSQLADLQDKLATALHSFSLLEDENAHLKDESQSEALRAQVRQLRDEVAQLSIENASLRTRIALLEPMPGGSAVPARPSAPQQESH